MPKKKLKQRTIDSFNRMLSEIDDFSGSKVIEIYGNMLNYGIDVYYDEAGRHYRVGTGSISSTIDTAFVEYDKLWSFCEQFEDQAKAYEFIVYMKEAKPEEAARKRWGV